MVINRLSNCTFLFLSVIVSTVYLLLQIYCEFIANLLAVYCKFVASLWQIAIYLSCGYRACASSIIIVSAHRLPRINPHYPSPLLPSHTPCPAHWVPVRVNGPTVPIIYLILSLLNCARTGTRIIVMSVYCFG